MKNTRGIALAGILAVAGCALGPQSADEPKPFGMEAEDAASWRLTFGDDFDGTDKDESKWYSGYRNGILSLVSGATFDRYCRRAVEG